MLESPRVRTLLASSLGLLGLVLPFLSARASADDSEPIHITRAAGPIEVDGNLDDPGWKGAVRIDTFYETNPGDSVPPKVKTVAWLTYDDHFFYAAFEFSDPNPKEIRAPYGDHDDTPSYTDYGGIILDTRNDGKTASMFLANPRGIQYDAISSDVSGEDNSPDFYWDSAGRIGPDGWRLEIRVPFSSLRYDKGDPQTWNILLYRNRPRDFRYQMFNVKLPRESSCFICHAQKIVGLTGLPSGDHFVLAPYATGKLDQTAVGDPGSRLSGGTKWDGGVDAKWTPNAVTAIDATINPDFSQVESDVAQISSNERFALFFPEKRPFFLEGLDLFATPIQAVYTRTITSPSWGVRATGQLAGTRYTLLATEDRGGGSVILPGPQTSGLANQDFSSQVVVGRARRDFGSSYASFLLTDREVVGSGHNRVFGPDFEWRPSDQDTIRGQFLYGDTQTPDRPELAAEWDGRRLQSHAAFAAWLHSSKTWDWTLQFQDIGDDFRADLGFLPQVGIRDTTAIVGWTARPETGLVRRIRPYFRLRNLEATDGSGLVLRRVAPGVDFEGVLNSFLEIEARSDRVRAGDRLFDINYLVGTLSLSPSQSIGGVELDVTAGDDVDVEGQRPARSATVALQGTLRPTDHLALALNGSRRWLDVAPTGSGPKSLRLFTADVARLKATYTFSSRAFLRLIGQQTDLNQNGRTESFSGSALFAYKINWQTVLFLGFGDDRALSEDNRLEPIDREVFLKVSYAFQR
ncbi:MAG TPA: DUF5916 domain-containing protein [Thermoanaerobaculia bacterium]|jgi:hypothetical protein|nr:DUF5916 domain-containing protein [Thermoanaerobaculia bacterium]